MLPLFLSLSLLILTQDVLADPLHIPITRRALGARDIDWYAAAADRLRGKYGYPVAGDASQRMKKRAGVASIGIINQQTDASYFGTVNIGTPAQPFNVILDTGSSDLWVATVGCRTCDSDTPLYDPSKSSSQVVETGRGSTTTIQYGSGAVAGTLAQETVEMGNFTVNSQTFLEVSQVTSQLLQGSVSGIMGLAFQSISATQSIPFWQALVNDNQLSTPEMSFFLTRERGSTQQVSEEEPGGVFTLGGTNSSLFSGNIEFLNTQSSESFWLLNVRSINVQGSSISLGSGTSLAAIDTGTTLIGGPSDAVNNIYDAIPGASAIINQNGFFSFPCSTTVNISMSFGGTSWNIDSRDINLGPVTTGSSSCLGGIFDLSQGSNIASGSGNPAWVVGDTFLKNVYSVFRASNPAAVGFAALSSEAGGSGAPASTTGGDTSSSGNGAFNTPVPMSGLLVTILFTALLCWL